MSRTHDRSNRSPRSILTLASLLGGLFSLLAVPSAAAVLPATGTYSVLLATLPAVVLHGSGSASSAGGPGSGHTIPAGFFTVGPTPFMGVIQPTFTGIAHFSVPVGVENGAGSFGPNGSMPLLGAIQFFAKGGTPGGTVPLTPIGGVGTASFMIGGLDGILVGATFQGAGGPTPLVIPFPTAALAIPITLTATAFDNRTAGGAGLVQLVAPATGSLGIFGAVPVFGVVPFPKP